MGVRAREPDRAHGGSQLQRAPRRWAWPRADGRSARGQRPGNGRASHDITYQAPARPLGLERRRRPLPHMRIRRSGRRWRSREFVPTGSRVAYRPSSPCPQRGVRRYQLRKTTTNSSKCIHTPVCWVPPLPCACDAARRPPPRQHSGYILSTQSHVDGRRPRAARPEVGVSARAPRPGGYLPTAASSSSSGSRVAAGSAASRGWSRSSRGVALNACSAVGQSLW